MKCCIVTGASSGMGREFVLQLDRHRVYDEIWVVARRAERLGQLQESCRARVVPVAADLTSKDGLDALRQKLQSEKPEVQTLVNAAGFGRFGEFRTLEEDEQAEMIDLNVTALTRVTHMTLPCMRADSEIYNVGSLSSFQPVPYLGVYAAGKAFVLSFTRSLNVELKKHRIRAMAVCPGWVRTEFFDRAATDDTITYYNRYYNAEQVVARALRDMAKGKDVSVMGLPVRNQVRLVKLLPHRLVMKIWCRQQKK